MGELLRRRVQERLDALQINPFEAARRAGVERSYVNDLLIGKKSTLRESILPRIADALECDPPYLTGLQGVPRAGGDVDGNMGLAVAGICEAGAWREPGADIPSAPLPFAPDPRYPIDQQLTFLVRGDHAAGFGVGDGSLVITILGTHPRIGDTVVVRRKRRGGEAETTIRRVVVGGGLTAAPLTGSIPPLTWKEVETIGLVVVAFRVFTPPH